MGDTIQSGLAPVGNVVGKGLSTVTAPLGQGLIEPTVGTIMKAGEAFGTQANVGFGNKEGGRKSLVLHLPLLIPPIAGIRLTGCLTAAKQAEAEGKRMKEPVGGKDQDGENPLGL